MILIEWTLSNCYFSCSLQNTLKATLFLYMPVEILQTVHEISSLSEVLYKKSVLKIFKKLAGNTRCRQPKVFCRKRVLKSFTNYLEKHLCRCQNFVGSMLETLLKKRPQYCCFLENFVSFLRTLFCRTSGNNGL